MKKNIKYYQNINLLLRCEFINDKAKVLNYIPKYDVYCREDKIIFNYKSTSYVYKEFQKQYVDYGIYVKYTNSSFIFMNEFFIENIINIQEKCNVGNEKLYLYYENLEEFLEVLQFVDISSINTGSNIIFLFGESDLEEYFMNTFTKIPENYINVSKSIIKKLYYIKLDKIENLKLRIDEYYSKRDLSEIRKNFKILICHNYMDKIFYKQFVSALEYGKFLYRSTSDINSFSSTFDEYAFLNYVHDYKPSALLVTNLVHQNFPYYINEKLIVISFLDWVPHLFTYKDYLNVMGKYTFLLVPFLTLENILDQKVVSSKNFENNLIKIPFTCNHREFKSYTLSNFEYNEYKSDICIVGSFFGVFKKNFCTYYNKLFVNNLKYFHSLKTVWDNMCELVYYKTDKEGKLICDIKWFKDTLIEQCKTCHLDIQNISSNNFEIFVKILFDNIVPGIFRYAVLNWIVDKGYDLKIWGNNSEIEDKFKKYTRYYIENGVELSKVYNACKINLNINPSASLHVRGFESILSNCFFLTHRNSEWDFSNIETIFKKNRNIDFYSNKEELYNKLNYYLEDNLERENIIKSGKKLIINNKFYTDEVLKRAIEQVILKIEQKLKSEII